METSMTRFTAPPLASNGATWATLDTSLQERLLPFVRGDASVLTMTGPTGVGKTWAAWATFAAMTGCTSRYFVNWYDLNGLIIDSGRFGGGDIEALSILHRLESCDLLVIDMFADTRLYYADRPIVVEIVRRRLKYNRPLLLTTLGNEPKLVASVGKAMVSRINNSGIVVRMFGRDKRAERKSDGL